MINRIRQYLASVADAFRAGVEEGDRKATDRLNRR